MGFNIENTKRKPEREEEEMAKVRLEGGEGCARPNDGTYYDPIKKAKTKKVKKRTKRKK